jgi:hypothetical protein
MRQAYAPLSHPVLTVILALLLALLLLGAMTAIETSGRRTEHAVMAGIVSGNAADHGALQAAFGFGVTGRAANRDNDEECSDELHDDLSLPDPSQHALC